MIFTAERMRQALAALDQRLQEPLTLIIGGGGALVLAHGIELATADIDAVPQRRDIKDLKPVILEVAQALSLPSDWLNPYYATFAHTLPRDYGDRLVPVFEGQFLQALALGAEEMLIMKAYAGRKKDQVHARDLLKKKKVDLVRVEAHIEALKKAGVLGSDRALDFIDEVQE